MKLIIEAEDIDAFIGSVHEIYQDVLKDKTKGTAFNGFVSWELHE